MRVSSQGLDDCGLAKVRSTARKRLRPKLISRDNRLARPTPETVQQLWTNSNTERPDGVAFDQDAGRIVSDGATMTDQPNPESPKPMSREWNYHPDLPLANPSIFQWPPSPGFLGRWFVRNWLMLSDTFA